MNWSLLRNWVNDLLIPSSTNLKDPSLDEMRKALVSPAVQKVWFDSLVDEIWAINIKVDRMMEEERSGDWRKLSARRNAIVWCLQQILDAQIRIDDERQSTGDNLLKEAVQVEHRR